MNKILRFSLISLVAAVSLWTTQSRAVVTPINNPQITGAVKYLQTDSIANLRLIPITQLADGYQCQVSGYYAKNDGGGGPYIWNASSTATDDGGSVIQPSGVVNGRWLLQYNGTVNVQQFGAKGDGATDDTAAIASALAVATTINVKGGRVYFPPNKTYLCQINIVGTINAANGEHGVILSGYGATLKGRASDIAVIRINNATPASDPSPGSTQYANGIVVEGFDVDMSAMSNTANTYFYASQRSYDGTLRDIRMVSGTEPALGGAVYLGNNTYTTTLVQVHGSRFKIHGYNASDNLDSTHNLYGCTFYQAVIDNAFMISFYGCTVQGNADHFVLSSCSNICVVGSDLEGSGGHVFNFGSSVVRVYAFGNVPGGYDNTSYSTGVAPYSLLLDRPAFGVAGASGLGSSGTNARSAGSAIVSISTSPLVIYPWTDITPTTSGMGIFQVSGDNGSNGFSDVVLVSFQAVAVVSSNVMYGSPPVRTYAFNSAGLKLSVASGTYNVRVSAVEQLGN